MWDDPSKRYLTLVDRLRIPAWRVVDGVWMLDRDTTEKAMTDAANEIVRLTNRVAELEGKKDETA